MRGADLSTYKIDGPAKLFIAGEYAVTRPGGLALVTSLESDFQVVISEAEGHFDIAHAGGGLEYL